MEHIPVVQIDLSVPLKVPGKYLLALSLCSGHDGVLGVPELWPFTFPAGMPMSDQYVKLEEQRRHRQRLEKDKKRKKKEKGKRRHSSLPTESDEDIAPAQRVDIITEEMPEVSPFPAL